MKVSGMRGMRRLCQVGLLVAAMALCNVVVAIDYYWVGASNDWWNAASYSLTNGGAGGTVMPGRDDEIIVPSGSELYADDTTIAFFGTVGAIHMNADNVRFTVTITTNSVFGCPIGQLTRDDYNSSGTGTAFTNHIFVKEGPGKLTFDTSNKACVGGAYNLNTGFHVKEGEIDFGASWGPKINHTFKRLIVEKDATVHCMTNGAMYFKGIWGAGTIAGPTSANSALKFLINQSPEQRMDPEALDVPTVFSGKITGNFNWFVPYGSTLFTGTESDFTASELQVYGISATRHYATCGFAHLGNKGTVSSLGMNDTIHFTRGPVILKYTGDGDEETDRDFIFYDSSIAPLVVDAGSSGSLAVNGAFRHNSTGYVQHRVTFAGSNPSAVCVASNKFTSITDPDSGEKCSFFVRKSGTGTWRFADRSADNALSGVVGVDGGTLEFDTIRNIGGQCSLGDATALYEDKGVAIAEMSKVPYAHFIGGGDSDATFSYVGSHVAYMEDRPIAVSGRGRLQAGNSKAFAWKRFMGAGSGEKRIAYVCAAGQTNLVANVTDANGGAQGTLSVVKEGPGDLVLSGDLSFGGDLVAQGGGTLTVRDISGERYEYYRLVLKETAAVSSLPEYAHLHVYTTTSNSKQNDSRRVSLCEFGLYNSSGGRLNTYANTSTNSSVVTMQPKQIALQDDWPIVFYAQNNLNTIKHVGFLTDASTASGAFFEMRWKDNTKYLNLDDPTTWVKIVVRLPKANAGAASFDLNYVYAYTNTVDGATSSQPTAFSIEGSVNGLNWSELYSTNNVVFKSPNYYFWLSSMTSSYTNKNFTSSEKMRPENVWHGRIPFSSTVDATDYVVLDNVRAIGAAAGTTLKFEGATAPVVHGLKVDAAGSGTIDGFSFAAGDGTLYVENVDPGATAIDVPADFRNATGLANVAGWSLCVNGAENGKYAITSVTAGSIRIIKHGFGIVIR